MTSFFSRGDDRVVARRRAHVSNFHCDAVKKRGQRQRDQRDVCVWRPHQIMPAPPPFAFPFWIGVFFLVCAGVVVQKKGKQSRLSILDLAFKKKHQKVGRAT
nr:hypothetical protein [Pandoravirus aubagnensis]